MSLCHHLSDADEVELDNKIVFRKNGSKLAKELGIIGLLTWQTEKRTLDLQNRSKRERGFEMARFCICSLV